MIQTFQFRTEMGDKNYYYTVHPIDIETAIYKRVRTIEDLQNQVYSFGPNQVQTIKQQFSNGQLKIHEGREPYFLTFQMGDKHEFIHIDKVNKGDPDFITKVTYVTTEQEGGKG
jgi:hypothetical protein